MRKIALDIGSKSCGVAISDPSNKVAHAKQRLLFSERNWTDLVAKLVPFFQDYEFDTIIVGYPTLPSGDKSKTTLMIEEAADFLSKVFKIPVIFVDENHTTKQALNIVREVKIDYQKAKNYKDQLAAQIFLQEYLDALEYK